ncbi:MAG: DUF2927 domain-containing protein [Flavobacteriaceae bacterium]|nr:MAG: DUF2927 domain-containing protein [Flavobacteriaceae bacterium]
MLINSSKLKLILFVLIPLICGVFIFEKTFGVNYTPTEYEKELISYFNEVVMKSEYIDNPNKVIKWKKPMCLSIYFDEEYQGQMKAIERTINNINKLATDGFKIKLSDNMLESNSILYICNFERLSTLNHNFHKKINDFINYETSGVAYTEFNEDNYTIDKALIYINSEDPLGIQESTILEEITQSIGLPNDPLTYPNSIFYKDKSEDNNDMKEYTKMDTDIVRLLYHPKMKPGLNSKQTKRIIKKILKEEAKSVNKKIK